MEKTEKKLVVCFLVVFAALNLVGYAADIDPLKTFVATPGSRSIHFVSLAAGVAVSAAYAVILSRRK